MPIQYPSELDTLSRPQAGNPLNNPSHAGVHDELADAIEALQEKVGVDDSEDIDSLEFRVSNPQSRWVFKETPSGSLNGSNTVFTLSQTPWEGSEHVFLNGMLLEAGDDYTISGNEITLSVAPESGEKLRVTYMVN